ncbi:MAG: spore protease YyaC [Bacillota bacterium]
MNVDDPEATHRLADFISRLYGSRSPGAPVVALCIGTDRSTGDALGPLAGTELSQHGGRLARVHGTLDAPVHAANLREILASIGQSHPRAWVIAIDACLGSVENVGTIAAGSGPLRPGAGVNKDLPPVGDAYVTGVVNVGGFMEYFVLQNTRLNLVVRMAKVIAQGVAGALNRRTLPLTAHP